MPHSIALGDKFHFTISVNPPNYAVGVHPPFAGKENNFAGFNFARVGAPNGNGIARPDRRRHAGALHAEANSSELANHFFRKLAGRRVRTLHGRLAGVYDALRLNLQLRCVGPTLPQANAVTSNTRSERKLGAWYFFLDLALPSVSRGASAAADSLLVVIVLSMYGDPRDLV